MRRSSCFITPAPIWGPPDEGAQDELKTSDFDYEKYGINDKEKDIISLVAQGLSNKEIATELFLSEGTVRNYLSSILEKLELRDRTQLAIFYYNNNK